MAGFGGGVGEVIRLTSPARRLSSPLRVVLAVSCSWPVLFPVPVGQMITGRWIRDQVAEVPL